MNNRVGHDRSADGLRGVASLNVVLCHFISAFCPALVAGQYPEYFTAPTDPSPALTFVRFPLWGLAFNGHFAVAVFFVLSGYVLTLPYWTGHSGKLRERLVARYPRLFIPIIASLLLSVVCYRLGWFRTQQVAALTDSRWLHLYFDPARVEPKLGTPLHFLAVLATGSAALNPPLWSLRIEFIGSMLLLAYYLLKPRGRDALGFAGCVLVLGTLFRGDAIHYAAIFIGAWLGGAPRVSAATRWYLAVAGLYLGAFTYDHPMFAILPDPKWIDAKSFYNTLGAACLVSAVINGFGRRCLTHPWAQFLGKVSFALYLTHFLVLSSVACAAYLSWGAGPGALGLNLLAYLSVSLLLAWLFARGVDLPAMEWARRFGRRWTRPVQASPEAGAVPRK